MTTGRTKDEPSSPLWEALLRAARDVEAMLKERGYPGRVFPAAALSMGPQHSSLWVAVDTDKVRDTLKTDATLVGAIRQKVREAGYPEACVPTVGVVFESQETVDRKYEGSWFYAMR